MVHLEIVLVSVQDRCTVYAKPTIGLDIVFNALMVLLGDEAQVEAPFSPLKMMSEPVVRLAQTVHLSSTDTNTISKRSETRFHKTHVT